MTIVDNRYRGKKEYFLVYAEMINAAKYRGTVTYQEVAQIMGLWASPDISDTWLSLNG